MAWAPLWTNTTTESIDRLELESASDLELVIRNCVEFLPIKMTISIGFTCASNEYVCLIA
jgi:hypothetical protein